MKKKLKVGQTARVFEITDGVTYGGDTKGRWTSESGETIGNLFKSCITLNGVNGLNFWEYETKLVGKLTVTRVK